MKRTLLVLNLILFTVLTFGQYKTNKVKLNQQCKCNSNNQYNRIIIGPEDNCTEIFYVITDSVNVKHGKYESYINDDKSCSGFYKLNKKSGIWNFYDFDGKIKISYDFDKDSLVSSLIEDTCKAYDRQPILLSSDVDFYSCVKKNIIYPEYARMNNISGTVVLAAKIDSTGKLQEVYIKKSVEQSLDNEALRVVKTVAIDAEWIPAKKDGISINSEYYIPISYALY